MATGATSRHREASLKPLVNYYEDVITGRIRVPADRFVGGGPRHARHLRFVATSVNDITRDSPTRSCPAHRDCAVTFMPHVAVNDDLWDLLIDIYHRSGRFG